MADDLPSGLAEANSLANEGQIEASIALLEILMDRHPTQYEPALRLTQLCFSSGDRGKVIWRLLRATRSFEHLAEPWIYAIRALREGGYPEYAAPVVTAGLRSVPDHHGLLVEAADVASATGDIGSVRSICDKIRRMYPGIVEAYVIEMRILRSIKDNAGTRALLDLADTNSVRHPSIEVERIMLAIQEGEPESAARYAALLRAEYPNMAEGYVLSARALRIMGLNADARTVIAEGAAVLPDNVNVAIERIETALAESRAEDALFYCDQALERFPHVGDFSLLAAHAREAIDARREASSLAAALANPDAPEPAVAAAQFAKTRRDWAAAAERWTQICARFPQLPDGYVNAGEALLQLGRADDAEPILAEGVKRVPHDFNLARLHALCAHRRQDWQTALLRWQSAIERFPNSEAMPQGLAETRVAIDLARLDGQEFSLRLDDLGGITNSTRAILAAAGVTEWPDRSFFLGFEGLGDNCAFGGFQRIFGAEPLGLLRWANVSPSGLLDMMRTRFVGIGAPENTYIEENEVSHEYYGGDRRYFRMHTFVQAQDVPPDRMLSQMWRRLRFLRDKMVEDLTLGEKIFVYIRAEGDVSDDELIAIHEAMQSYGKPALLGIRRARMGEAAKDGAVDKLADNLLVGTVANLEHNPVHIHRVSAAILRILQEARRLIPSTGSLQK